MKLGNWKIKSIKQLVEHEAWQLKLKTIKQLVELEDQLVIEVVGLN